MTLRLVVDSTPRKATASQSSDISPSKAVAERTRKKTMATEITGEESTEVKGRLSNMPKPLKHVQLKEETKNEIEETMESYVVKCEKTADWQTSRPTEKATDEIR